MTSSEAVNDSGYGHPECLVCGDDIRLEDAFADRRVRQPDGGTAIERGHRACLREGVERWNRLNRPHTGPLDASRRDGWKWHAEPPVHWGPPDTGR